MLTQEKLNNIHKLPLSEVKQILNECEEALGVTDMETASNVLGIGKRRVYQLMNEGNSISIGSHKFICINLL